MVMIYLCDLWNVNSDMYTSIVVHDRRTRLNPDSHLQPLQFAVTFEYARRGRLKKKMQYSMKTILLCFFYFTYREFQIFLSVLIYTIHIHSKKLICVRF